MRTLALLATASLLLVSTPAQSKCVIRPMVNTDSDPCRTPVPTDAEHRFRRHAEHFVPNGWNRCSSCPELPFGMLRNPSELADRISEIDAG